jgi:DNA-binding MarR family transcriptional regulator
VIEEWATVRPELDTAPVAIVARLGRATAYLDGWIDQALAEYSASRPSWDVLASLRRIGPPYRLSPTELYRSLMRSSGAITHRLAALEGKGLIRRVSDPEDRRGLLVELTPAGLELVDRIAPAHLDTERRLLAPLSAEEQRDLAALLAKLLTAFEQQEPAPPPRGRGGRHRRRVGRRRKL